MILSDLCFRPLAGVNYNEAKSMIGTILVVAGFPSPCGGEL